jgi:thiopurine S-methyltransferase
VESSFWIARWSEGRIGFHEGKPNAFLERHGERLAGAKRVLVPLCGKAVDLAYLAGRGHEVVGVELVADAVQQFFAEHGVTPVVTPRGAFVEYTAGAITIFAGDWFATDAALLGAIDAVYDRAALIALPPEMRARYAAHARALAGAAPILLVTLEYPQELMDGPPFSVAEEEVRALYAGARIELVDDAAGRTGRLPPDAPCREKCYVITAGPT